MQHSDGEFPYQLVGQKVTVEGLAEQVAELDGKRSGWSDRGPPDALATFDRIQDECREMTPQECAARLRKFNYDVAENLAAALSEDGYTVTKTVTARDCGTYWLSGSSWRACFRTKAVHTPLTA